MSELRFFENQKIIVFELNRIETESDGSEKTHEETLISTWTETFYSKYINKIYNSSYAGGAFLEGSLPAVSQTLKLLRALPSPISETGCQAF